MSSRQEEKEKRKQERLERERAAAAAAKRTRLLQIGGGAIVAVAVIAGVALAVVGGGGGGDRPDDAAVRSAATAAGCTYKRFPDEGRGHTAEPRTKANYDTNPPTSGDHGPAPAQDGLYPTGNEPPIANWMHTLEHGRILLQYKPGTDADAVAALTTLFNEPVLDSDGSYHMALMQNNSDMPFQTAAVAWRGYVGCKDASPKSIAAMRVFRDRWVDQAPEVIP